MTRKMAPLEMVNKLHGGKDKLVEKILGLLGDKASDKETLLSAANSKLLRLHKTLETIKQKYGSTEKLADALAKLTGREKDEAFKKKLVSLTPGKLLDLVTSKARQAKAKA